MDRAHGFAYPHDEYLALEANIERAGMALACAYSSSAEFEAAVIDARRAQWKVGRQRRAWLWVVAPAIVALLALSLVAY